MASDFRFLRGEHRDWGGAGRSSSPEKYRERFCKRFWANVNKNGKTMRPGLGQCWEWTGARVSDDSNGYGQMGIAWKHFAMGDGYAPIRVHVAAWIIIYGHSIPPKGWHVCHECNNKLCIREDHLWVGTAADNVHHAQATGLMPKIDHEQRERERVKHLNLRARTEREFIDRHLHLLTPRQQEILTLRFGYTHESCYTLEKVGKLCEVTGERIRQIEEKALEKIWMLTIEKDIPIPFPGSEDLRTELLETFEAMEPGDSFVLEGTQTSKTIRNMRILAKHHGCMIATRTIDDTHVRIWLVSKPEESEST